MFHKQLRALFLVSLATPILSWNTYPKNCKELQSRWATSSGIYTIKPDTSPKPFYVYCDMETQNGGWVYVLNRLNHFENFARPWAEYKHGFGDLAREHWLGLEHLYELTNPEASELLVELVDWNSTKYHAYYKVFSIDDEENAYRIQVLGGFSGNAGDSLSPHAGRKFSTPDRDNDELDNQSCLRVYGKGGWWYRNCFSSQLTGLYLPREQAIKGNFTGINWQANRINIPVEFYSYKEARMMIRPQTDYAVPYY